MKKLILLGGSFQQIVAIEMAKKLGYYTILCDYLDDNPGQYVADKFYLESTTDKEKILEIAQKEEVCGILAYASDPAAPTAAYVSERMGLPGSPYESVEILCNKDKFRKFLKEHNFCTPEAGGYSDAPTALADIRNHRFKIPFMIKPVDSSGSKGITLVQKLEDAESAIDHAMDFSRSKRIVIEDYVKEYGYQVAGDGFSVDGKLVFYNFGNDHFDRTEGSENPFVPISASFPYNQPKWVSEKIASEVQRLLTELHMGTTAYNFDIRIDQDYNVYLMEVAPRDGGNYIPQIIKQQTGIDLVELSVRAAGGEKMDFPESWEEPGFYSYYAIHSHSSGILKEIRISDEFRSRHIIQDYTISRPGDEIYSFTGANKTLGILLMKFDSMEQMLDMMDHSEQWIQIITE